MGSTAGFGDDGTITRAAWRPARGRPSEGLAKGGREAERVGLQHSGVLFLARFAIALPGQITKAVAGSC